MSEFPARVPVVSRHSCGFRIEALDATARRSSVPVSEACRGQSQSERLPSSTAVTSLHERGLADGRAGDYRSEPATLPFFDKPCSGSGLGVCSGRRGPNIDSSAGQSADRSATRTEGQPAASRYRQLHQKCLCLFVPCRIRKPGKFSRVLCTTWESDIRYRDRSGPGVCSIIPGNWTLR